MAAHQAIRFLKMIMSLEEHPLIVPKSHFRDLFDLDGDHAAAIMKAAMHVARATKATMQCDGINLVRSIGAVAGQDVFHFLLHIKPRFVDDDVIMKWDTATLRDESRKQISSAIRRNLRKSP